MSTIEQVFNLLSPSELLEPVQSRYLLDKLLVTKLGMVPPQQVELGSRETWTQIDTPPYMELKEQKIYGQHIPFLESLKRLLQKEEIRHQIENPVIQEGETMKTVLHGSVYKNHPFFSRFLNALAIIFNGDELSVANNQGPSAKKEKIFVFYWTLANVHPNFRSIRDNIYLLAIAKSVDLKDFEGSMNNLLRPFVDDIRTLQTEGVTIVVQGREINYKGSLLFSTCDNPAAAELGGFKQTMTAYRFCRTCMTTSAQWRHNFRESAYTLRDAETHRDHLAAINGPNIAEADRDYWSTTFGVNGESPLADIEHLDITQCFPQDPMHVLLEGIVPTEMKALLNYLVYDRRLFTLEELNAYAKHFDYDHFKVNKPGPLTPDSLERANGFHQSASQIVTLAYSLPFLVAPWITDEEPVKIAMDLHIRLLQILNLVFAYEISEDSIDELERMIELFDIKFKGLYPDWLVHKFHCVIHLARYMRMYGPGRQQSCIRFEGAHQLFKSLVPVVRNFINMPYTLAYRHQARLCSRLQSPFNVDDKKFLYHGDDIVFGDIVLVGNLPNAQLLYDSFGGLVRAESRIMRARQIQRHGTTYKPQSVILLNCEDDSLPLFGAIEEIFVIYDRVVIIYKKLQTLYYSETLNAYRILQTSYEQETITLDDLKFPHPLPMLSCRGDRHVILLNYDRTEFYG